MDTTTTLLKELTEASGISGYEAPIREVVRKHLAPLGELTSDRIGSVVCRRQGTAQEPRIMLAGHMDEIGFMIKYITDDGFIKFLPLGGWFDQVLLGQRMLIKTSKGDVVGVVGIKAPHLIPRDERDKVIQQKDMYIDIGATNKKELEEAGVRVGDPIIPLADFRVMANGKSYLSKAFDDRAGVALMISLLQELKKDEHPNTIFAAATVLEEFNLGGATTTAEVINPDVAIILEVGIAGDTPDVKPEECSVKLAGGPVILLYDSLMVPNLKLRDLFIDTAQEIGIPIQMDTMRGGATDGGRIHLHGTGVPTIVLGVPARHIHSHSSILYRDDYDQTVALLKAVVKKLDKNIVKELAE
jgi:putative aminopeptidase FrvX